MSEGTTDLAQHLLRRLEDSGPIVESVAMIVAHPDDETIGAAGTLARFLDLTLIHVTDGAPADPSVARAHGFAAQADYAAARQEELTAALAAACVRPVRRIGYGITDGTLAQHTEDVAGRLLGDMMSVEAVLTHAWEGGHVDHDACARAVHAAANRLAARSGRRVPILEFAGYYRRHGLLRTGAFWPDPDCPEIAILLSAAALHRRQAAFACFRSQARNLDYFWSTCERFRVAPLYHFSDAPPPERPGPTAP